MYDDQQLSEAIHRICSAALGISMDAYEELHDAVSEIADAIRQAMAPAIEVLEKIAELVSEAVEVLAEEDTHQHHTIKLYSCKMPGIFHRHLIPWYPSGFT